MTNYCLQEYSPETCADATLHVVIRFQSGDVVPAFEKLFSDMGGRISVRESGGKYLLNILADLGSRIDWFLQRMTMVIDEHNSGSAPGGPVEIIETRLVSHSRTQSNDGDLIPQTSADEEEYSLARSYGLEFDSGAVFGSGTHPSTCLAIAAIEEIGAGGESFPASVLDIGCGSGLLALICAAKGGSDILGVDICVEAITIARENVDRNGLTGSVRITDTPLLEIRESFQLILANLTASVLMRSIDQIRNRLLDGGTAVLSGFQGSQGEVMKDLCRAEGLMPVGEYSDGRWRALRCRRE
ncbi:50S ribosomal protein L11 methyltransferase [Thermodesulfobacteriota bacterium]